MINKAILKSAAALIRRRCSLGVDGCRRRSLATETQTQTQPLLMLSSPSKPQSRYFYEIDESTKLKRSKEVEIPEISEQICIGSSEGYLFSIDIRKSPEVNAINPFTRHRLSLPPFSTLPEMDVHCINRSYILTKSWINSSTKVSIQVDSYFYNLFTNSKVTVSPDLDNPMVVLHRRGYPPIFYARPGVDDRWSSIPAFPLYRTINDVIFNRGRLHAVTGGGELTVLDRSMAETEVTVTEPPRDSDAVEKVRLSYIVVSPDGDDLFLVLRMAPSPEDKFSNFSKANNVVVHETRPVRTDYFKVFKLDRSSCFQSNWRWVESRNIGDIALFLGNNHSLARPAPPGGSLKPNSIYFTDHFLEYLPSHYFSVRDFIGDTGVFNLEDRTVVFFPLQDGTMELNWPHPIWFTPSSPH